MPQRTAEGRRTLPRLHEIKTHFIVILIGYFPKEGKKKTIQAINELVDYLNIRSKLGSKMTSNFLATSTKLSSTLFEVLSGKSWARCYC